MVHVKLKGLNEWKSCFCCGGLKELRPFSLLVSLSHSCIQMQLLYIGAYSCRGLTCTTAPLII